MTVKMATKQREVNIYESYRYNANYMSNKSNNSTHSNKPKFKETQIEKYGNI